MRKLLAIALILSMPVTAFASGGGGSSGGGGGSSGGGSGGGSGSSGGGGSGNGGNNRNTVQVCNAGHIYDKHMKKCVAKASGIIPNADVLAQAWVLAKSGRLEDGRDLFTMVFEQEPRNPEALNGLGYTNRKLGNFDIAFGYYNRALDIDPNYLDAREYLGEGYAVAGRIDLAKQQLAEIAKRGGTRIEQFADLSEAIDQAIKSAAVQQ
jgi:tetratricopeptide (TPR) repeat protein